MTAQPAPGAVIGFLQATIVSEFRHRAGRRPLMRPAGIAVPISGELSGPVLPAATAAQ